MSTTLQRVKTRMVTVAYNVTSWSSIFAVLIMLFFVAAPLDEGSSKMLLERDQSNNRIANIRTRASERDPDHDHINILASPRRAA